MPKYEGHKPNDFLFRANIDPDKGVYLFYTAVGRLDFANNLVMPSFITRRGQQPKPDQLRTFNCRPRWPKSPDMDAFVKNITQMCVSCAVAKFGADRAKQLFDAGMVSPLMDGDDPRHASKELQGWWFHNAKTNGVKEGREDAMRPTLYAPNGQPYEAHQITEANIYSGMWGRMIFTAFAYENLQTGVGLRMQGVLKMYDDTNLGVAVTDEMVEKGLEGLGVDPALLADEIFDTDGTAAASDENALDFGGDMAVDAGAGTPDPSPGTGGLDFV